MRISRRNAILCLFDMFCFWCVAAGYYVLSIFSSEKTVIDNPKIFIADVLIMFAVMFVFRVVMRAYNTIWRYTSTEAYFSLVIADISAGIASYIVSRCVNETLGFGFFVTLTALATLLALLARFTYRLLYKKLNNVKANTGSDKKNICIIGAGQTGVFLANELRANEKSLYAPVGFIDIDISKIGSKIVGLCVYSEDKIDALIEKYGISEVVVAIGHINGKKLSEIKNFYEGHGCKIKIYDAPLNDGADGKRNRVIRDFSIEDLLFRDELIILDDTAKSYYKDKVVMVTGGGGSIGSELCRQIAKCEPKKLIVFDVYENNAYDIQQELIRKYRDELDLSVEIGSVRDVKRLEYIFDSYRPQIVFHAAAHKHVPLMEHSSAEAIKNNVIGTYNTANMAEKYGTEKFVLISTDKAVNPTNIMGASKRLCEMVVQSRIDSGTSFAAVRFGNVLGSNGSVVPLFKKQIENGGPLTLTDKSIIRYFMTIPEASQLVMTAGAMAKHGELFVLDMGKPVKIYDLAVNMIKLSGLVPDVDIKIKEIGLRPGEKLFEELLIKTEALDKTTHKLIFIERDKPKARAEMDNIIDELNAAVERYENEREFSAVKDAIKKYVTTFKEPGEVNASAESSEEMKKEREGKALQTV